MENLNVGNVPLVYLNGYFSVQVPSSRRIRVSCGDFVTVFKLNDQGNIGRKGK